MGDSISEGTIVNWMKNPGDPVEEDEVIVVLETDKVSRGAYPFVHELVSTYPPLFCRLRFSMEGGFQRVM